MLELFIYVVTQQNVIIMMMMMIIIIIMASRPWLCQCVCPRSRQAHFFV